MALLRLEIEGDIFQDQATLEKFSRDASSYKILPRLVIAPKSEDDICKIVKSAINDGLHITCRSGGSGLSGSAIGKDIILDFKRYFNRVLQIGEKTIVQPGTILDDFLHDMESYGLMLPVIPSSSASCALGGNIGTRSTGPGTARYGTIDEFVTSIRFVSSNGEVIDTDETLPSYLEEGIRRIRAKFLDDSASLEIIQNRPYIAGGYNLKALSRYLDPAQIVTHLLVGSVGTLGIITEIRLRLISRQTAKATFVAHFKNFDHLIEAADELKKLNPSALEFTDASCSKHVKGKLLNMSDSAHSGTLIVEFDNSQQQVDYGRELLKNYDLLKIWEIHAGDKNEAILRNERKQLLPSLWKFARENNLFMPSIIDDIAIHLKDFSKVHREISILMKHLGQDISFFGHLGFGSVHAHPYFNRMDSNLNQKIAIVSSGTFEILKKYKGTLVGAHNAGRSCSIYLKEELGKAFKYMEMIKTLFDPDNLLNPGTVFNTAPIYEQMMFSM
ncbi:FAD-binding oxidoreductase [candidate division KSB1 bacterium]|nr:FAD-binding oxidoreductase [candidate division KSB1 bacterium]